VPVDPHDDLAACLGECGVARRVGRGRKLGAALGYAEVGQLGIDQADKGHAEGLAELRGERMV